MKDKAVGIACAVAALVSTSSCEASQRNTQEYCGKSFSAKSTRVSGVVANADVEDFVVHNVDLDGLSIVVYEGNGVKPEGRGILKGRSGIKWHVSRQGRVATLDAETGRAWPRYVRVTFVSNDGSDIQRVVNSISIPGGKPCRPGA